MCIRDRPKEVEAFVADKDPKAFEKLVDRLLASESFGERWGRHWLDVARYAESSGKEANLTYPHAWRYLSLIHISEPTRLLSISYAVFCLKKKKKEKKK